MAKKKRAKSRPAEKTSSPPLIPDIDKGPPWLRGFVLVAGLLIGVAIVFPGPAFQGEVFNVPDHQAARSLGQGLDKVAEATGQDPHWNPLIFCGMPNQASLVSHRIFYPPAVVLKTVKNLLGGPPLYWLLAHYLFAGLGMALLLRRWGLRTWFALLGGLLFIAMPNYVAIGANGHGSKAMSIAYLPWILLCLEALAVKGRALLKTVLLGTVLGFLLLRAHPQIAYYTFMVIGLHTLLCGYLWVVRDRDPKRFGLHILCLAGAGVIAFALGASVYLPFLEYAPYSIRGAETGGGASPQDAYRYATDWSLHPKEIATFIHPWAFGFGKITYFGEMPFTDYPNYLGMLTLLLGAAAVAWRRDRITWFLVAVVALSTLIAFGRYLPILFRPLYEVLPYFKKFRVPVMILILQQFGAVLLAMRGAETLMARIEEGKLSARTAVRTAVAGGVFLVVCLLATGLLAGGFRDNVIQALQERNVDLRAATDLALAAVAHWKSSLVLLGLFTALACGLVLAVQRKFFPPVFLALGLVVLMVTDLTLVDRKIVHPEELPGPTTPILVPSRAIEAKEEADDLIRFLKQDTGRFRIYPVGAMFRDNSYMNHGLASLGGYHAAKLKIYDDYIKRMVEVFQKRAYGSINMLMAKYLLVPGKLPDETPFERVFVHENRIIVYRNPGSMAPAWLVGNYAVVGVDESLDAILDPGFDPSERVYLNEDPGFASASGPAPRGQIRMIENGPNRIELEVEAPAPAVLVSSEIYYPAWTVTVDGEEAKLLRANYLLRAVPVDRGRHSVVFEFRSRATLMGSILTRAALSVIAAYLLISGLLWLRRRRKGGAVVGQGGGP